MDRKRLSSLIVIFNYNLRNYFIIIEMNAFDAITFIITVCLHLAEMIFVDTPAASLAHIFFMLLFISVLLLQHIYDEYFVHCLHSFNSTPVFGLLSKCLYKSSLQNE